MIGPIYHAGELAAQTRAGVSEQAKQIGATIRADMPKIAREFLQDQRMVVLAAPDSMSQVWVSALCGPPGFVQAAGTQTIEIRSTIAPDDPLAENLMHRSEIGLIAVEFPTRRRMKAKGKSERASDGTLIVHVARVYSQCTKYIQVREPISDSGHSAEGREVVHSQILSPGQQKWIASANTFFIGSFNPQTGADASHRGGNPGFVKVTGPETLVFPNYWGNSMLNTLGNITLDHHTGLLFIDFATGSTLQITGSASVIWDRDRVADFPGANQLVEFRIRQIIERPSALPLKWRFVAYSASNPG
ncbi:MAG TPA: pyridoxamine 5'-phosphate oxidase family protein [Terriglobia bacterium]|nr:pyridoxamine 5'-phosphate oxidase family protein [Terriglobia bacterium]